MWMQIHISLPACNRSNEGCNYLSTKCAGNYGFYCNYPLSLLAYAFYSFVICFRIHIISSFRKRNYFYSIGMLSRNTFRSNVTLQPDQLIKKRVVKKHRWTKGIFITAGNNGFARSLVDRDQFVQQGACYIRLITNHQYRS